MLGVLPVACKQRLSPMSLFAQPVSQARVAFTWLPIWRYPSSPHCGTVQVPVEEKRLAADLFFDISGISVDQVAVSAEEVGRLNPQCGEMRQLDHIVWLAPDFTQAVGLKVVRNDEFWVTCHIPGRPILPGVLMIEAGAQLCSILFKKKTGNLAFLGFIRCDDVVFRHKVLPGDKLYLMGKEHILTNRRFVSKVQGIVKDKLVFEATIAGMGV